MHSLSDKQLFDSYKKGIELNLDKEFIDLLEKELKSRGLEVEIA
ncbi:sporulation histidine kinase inhibitor Sda [Aquibacillus koreensis]|uniref:Sporulation histidine kinase inhibitor Sda n=1 Tax=Aquibacillus koreensis TaxID=279446 RepID=A0A9X3WI41_9BACI|nr:sporulation histidine kinase inhibitor Sda [Aquibacillus koreensis]MCT2536544.1 sporulation histidine kinase inhibitor Sda [Aquibacillus koreensis]MDC3419368.1 sporulation histidine kinase inhibitor Sda [Aquibacillus koreensis]